MEFAIDRREVLRYLGCGTTEPDEATAALDAQTAFQISSAILDMEQTAIVITHALEEKLLRRYDRILTLKNGSITESGTFQELMDKKGYFYSLFTVSQ